MASHLAEIAIRRKVALKSDAYYDDAKPFGEIAEQAFGKTSKSQINSLENIANSATRVADILDFIKRQTGRSKEGQRWRNDLLGKKLVDKFEQTLRRDAEELWDEISQTVPDHYLQEADQQTIHIRLCREFIRHLSAHYLYTTSIHEAARGTHE